MELTREGRSRRTVLRGGIGALLATLAGCTSGAGGSSASPSTGGAAGAESTPTATTRTSDWRTVELTDVTTDETFTIQGFNGRPVLLEFFAVWCPVCTSQQRELGTLVGRMDDLVAVSVNVDPNEDAEQVREHAAEYGFDWHYAVAPASMTKALIEEFGSVISNAPAAPVVRVCPDGTAALVEGRGLKSADDLEAAFDGC